MTKLNERLSEARQAILLVLHSMGGAARFEVIRDRSGLSGSACSNALRSLKYDDWVQDEAVGPFVLWRLTPQRRKERARREEMRYG